MPDKVFLSAGGNTLACNYDFERDNSHLSDLNVVLFCEEMRQHFDEVLPLHLEREIELFIYTREMLPPPPSIPSSSLLLSPVSVTLAAAMPYQVRDKNKEPEE